jgi:DNA polymerase III delta subunit
MAPRRKAPRRRAKRSFNISAIEAGTALSLAQSTGADQAVQAMLKGDIAGGIKVLQSNVMSKKQQITATLAGAFVAKSLTSGFGNKVLAKLGPIRIKA